ncbi:MAG: polysaccharide deacetylase family protein [Desulfovibrionaceae bacterium]
MAASLPVLLYHYVNKRPDPIAVHPDRFEAHLRTLSRGGWRSIGVQEAEAYFVRGEALPKKSVCITFDDGFLDNYVYAWPLLKKYGHKAIIFAVTGRLEEEHMPRPTLDGVWAGHLDEADLPQVHDTFVTDAQGYRVRRDPFFSWEEARLMEQSGAVHVAAHSMTHASVFKAGPDAFGPRTHIIRPMNRKRTFDGIDGPTPFGLPRLPEGPALSTRAFTPSPELLDMVRAAIPQSPAEADAYFKTPGNEEAWRARLAQLPPETWGAFEDTDAYAARVRRELAGCRETLQRHLGGDRPALCWPWGGHTPEAVELARACGYTLCFTTENGPNPPGGAGRIKRFKVRDKPASWLMSRVRVYSHGLAARLYASVKV